MIEVKDLSFLYKNSNGFSLNKLNFNIAEGEIFGFLGPSGSGKSTTQHILYKTLLNYSGEVLIDNKNLSSWGKEYYEKIGVGFELPNHYTNLTALENLKLFSNFYKKSQLMDFNKLFEMVGLENNMNQKISDFSKGMKMRMNFIRAIMHNPEILFFDEPTSGLDPVNAFKLKSLIKSLKEQGKTIFITTHNMATADELCDRVSFIVDGEIKVTDKPSSLKHQYGKKAVKVVSENGETSEFPLGKIGENNDFLELIKTQPAKIETLEASLEDVFIKITGKGLKK